MICFDLVRDDDETGVSGTGRVAAGVVFEDGTTVVRWLTRVRTTVVYECLADVFTINGHQGKTRIVPERGHIACSRLHPHGHELVWCHEEGEGWVCDSITKHPSRRAEHTRRLLSVDNEDGAKNYAAQYIMTAVGECGGSHGMTFKLDQIVY